MEDDIGKKNFCYGVLWTIVALALIETGRSGTIPLDDQHPTGPVDTTPQSTPPQRQIDLYPGSSAADNADSKGSHAATASTPKMTREGQKEYSENRVVNGQDIFEKSGELGDTTPNIVPAIPHNWRSKNIGTIQGLTESEKNGSLLLDAKNGGPSDVKEVTMNANDTKPKMQSTDRAIEGNRRQTEGTVRGENTAIHVTVGDPRPQPRRQRAEGSNPAPPLDLPQNSWCVLKGDVKRGDLSCAVWTYKKSCRISCHPGCLFAGKPAGELTCYRKTNTWEPEVQSCQCEIAVPESQLAGSPGKEPKYQAPKEYDESYLPLGEYDNDYGSESGSKPEADLPKEIEPTTVDGFYEYEDEEEEKKSNPEEQGPSAEDYEKYRYEDMPYDEPYEGYN